jgi:hypothetical protein
MSSVSLRILGPRGKEMCVGGGGFGGRGAAWGVCHKPGMLENPCLILRIVDCWMLTTVYVVSQPVVSIFIWRLGARRVLPYAVLR